MTTLCASFSVNADNASLADVLGIASSSEVPDGTGKSDSSSSESSASSIVTAISSLLHGSGSYHSVSHSLGNCLHRRLIAAKKEFETHTLG